ncbi:calcium/manganese antiporter SLC30A10 isoform X3 [Kogia breviceps]|uniref:calcium/manganese antiporter SLC30A10 isoform X3 n=1 Tax=Kogia breviceps TaxID=27615 RepID=UPI0034D3868B
MGRYSGKTCRLLFMLVLTVAFFVAELVSGYLGNSIALLSDSFNMLSDLISLCVGLSAGYIARRPRGSLSATYGYARAEVVGALGNAVFLTALCFTIFVEAVLRLARPERIDDPELVLIVGALGLAVNVVGLLIFRDCAAWFACCGGRRRQQQRHQQPAAGGGPRGVFPAPQGAEGRWHAAALPAPGRDSAVTLRVASVDRKDEKGATVFANVAGDSLTTQNEPEETMKKEKKSEALNIRVSKLSAVPGISSVHEVHIWELISGKIIATLHIKYQQDGGDQDASIKIREIFHNMGIHNVTIQFEKVDLKGPLEEKDLQLLCSSPCISKGCAKQLCCPPGALPLAHVNGCAERNGCPPLDLSQNDGLGRRQTAEVALEVSLEGCLSDHGQALSKSQEDSRYVNSTHF